MIGKKIDVERLDLERMKEKTTENPGILPYAHHSGSAIIKPDDKGKITGRAVAAMHSQTDMQMSQIYQASIAFEPLINPHYFLYQKSDGTDFMSRIAPEEWGRKKDFAEFIAEIKLLVDHFWDIFRKNT